MAKERVVVAKVRLHGDKVVQGETLAQFRKPEFALHAMRGLADQHRVLTTELGIFRNGALIPKEELGQAVAVG